MQDLLTLASWSLAAAALLGLPLYARRVRGRPYSIYTIVILVVSFPGALVLEARLVELLSPPLRTLLQLAFLAGIATTTLHLAHLVRARMRGQTFRALVSIPGQAFLASGFLSALWLLAWLPVRALLHALGAQDVLGVLAWIDFLPPGLAIASVFTSYGSRREIVRVRLGEEGPDELVRLPVERFRGVAPMPLPRRPLRIVQITDPHLGPWRSTAGLSRRIERLLDFEPDLVLLTGDYLTMESMGTPGALAEALRPLRAYSGRCFAALGNHDYEALEEVKEALALNDVTLLVDEALTVDTPAGSVEILGADWVRRGRRKHLSELMKKYPRSDLPRILLLHDPSAFAAVPEGSADLTLSGHTHGGQAGLVLFGLDWTVLSRSAWPDHGLFGRGRNRLYVHRGTGHYGFPLRVGVPSEESMLEIALP